MKTITLLGQNLHYTVLYQKKRKTIKIKFVNPSLIEITAPLGYPLKSVEELLQAKTSWLLKQLDKLAAIANNPVNKELTDGAKILYLGETKTLKITLGQTNSVVLRANTIEAQLSTDAALSKVLLDWYVKNAETTLAEKTKHWAPIIGVQPRRLTIRDQKTRWGSCSTSGNINFNWRIIMAPETIIDYLVVHELCHLKHPNHSLAFWQLVSQFIPDYKARRHWLRENGSLFGGIL
jgi:predicted metal-dependent hydrolase